MQILPKLGFIPALKLRTIFSLRMNSKFVRSYNITALLFPTISPATFNSDCKQNRRVRFVATLTLLLFL